MFAWLTSRKSSPIQESGEPTGIKLRKLAMVLTDFRQLLVKRVRAVNAMSSEEVRLAAEHLNHVVVAARTYAEECTGMMTLLQGSGSDGVGALIEQRAVLLRGHASDMSARATEQDERARHAALTAKSIAELALSIERLAGETRLLAINARVESSRLGVHSSGFSVLSAEMKRLSDEVAKTNERIGDLAALVGQALPLIAQHARDARQVMDEFSRTSSTYLEETERGVQELRSRVGSMAKVGASLVDDLLRAAQAALAHLQFQDVIAQDLRKLDAVARDAQLTTLTLLDADPQLMASTPAAEYTTLGDSIEDNAASTPAPGELTLF